MMYLTKTWGFDEPCGPLQFSEQGYREGARAKLQPGDLVVIAGTQGEPTLPSEQGRVLGLMQPTTEPVMTLDYDVTTDANSHDNEGNYKWPFALHNERAWVYDDRPLLKDLIDRKLPYHSATTIVELTAEEEARFAALRKREIALLPSFKRTLRTEGKEAARRGGWPPATTRRTGIMHVRKAPASTYCFELRGAREPAFKIGWAFDAKQRGKGFNHASLPSLGGLEYVPVYEEPWPTARQAFRMEHALLKKLQRYRSAKNIEVVVGIQKKELVREWTDTLLAMKRAASIGN